MKTFNILMIALFLVAGSVAAHAQQKRASNLTEVKIFLIKEIEESDVYDEKNPHGLIAVTRRVKARSPLRNALVALTEGATAAEEKRKLFSATFGIKLLSVRISRGTAYTYFTMPEGATFSGDGSPFIFQDAVERTALQFPAVKKVVVCLDGILDFGSESDESPTKCP